MASSSRAKGKRVEKLARSLLERAGYLVDQARATIKFCGPGKIFSSPCDFFGCIDLMAIKKDEGIRMVQVALSTHNIASKMCEIAAIKWPLSSAFTVEIWCYLGRSKWRNWNLIKDHNSPCPYWREQ